MSFLYCCSLLVLVSVSIYLLFDKINRFNGKLPPGQRGWPVIGESIEFLSTGLKGHPEKFIFDRMTKFSPLVFRTSIFLEDVAVFCGSTGNKFLFSNENKLVRVWMPTTIDKIILSSKQTTLATEAMKMKKILHNFIKPEALHQYIPVMDMVAQRHFKTIWEGKDKIMAYELAKNFTFSLACKIFISIEEPEQVNYLSRPFNDITFGLFSIPIDLPGTPFRRGINAANLVRKELTGIVKQRRLELAQGEEAASPTQDILSQMITFRFEDGKFMAEDHIVDRILGLLIAGHDTTSSACSFIVKYLAEYPLVYDQVYKEQIDIAESKKAGDLLNWEDVSRMKYSWNVACEVLRIASPGQGSFREAITDFMYNGYSIPKGMKLYWNTNSTHKNPEFFPEPEKFDPSRFDSKGPAPYTFVPFGGGPRMCPGKEYARLEMLVFMHHLVTRFNWEKLIPDEHIIVKTMAVPAKGLPIRLYPHKP